MPRANQIVLRRRARPVNPRNRQVVIAREARRRMMNVAGRAAIRFGRQAARRLAYNAGRNLRQRILSRRRRKRIQVRTANVAGTTHTTSRMIVRKTPAEQKFLRKLFKNHPQSIKHVNRFGFAWMGSAANSKTTWYSVCHLKFNNILDYFKNRIISPDQNLGTNNDVVGQTQEIGNSPQSTIYIGKCTFQYEIYNPTNYIMTVYIYDLVCKHDTPSSIYYNKSTQTNNSAPEACMRNGSTALLSTPQNPTWVIGDSTFENNTFWNTVGVKPTDYHLFNTMWKVKGMKKIILPPASSHHHVVVFNPKKKLTLGGFLYPRTDITGTGDDFKPGVAGLTQASLFGFEGQIAAPSEVKSDTTGSTSVGTLPGKLYIKCIRKCNVYNFPLTAELMYSNSSLNNSISNPYIFSNLEEHPPDST